MDRLDDPGYFQSQVLTLNGEKASVDVSHLEPFLDILQPNATPHLRPQNEPLPTNYYTDLLNSPEYLESQNANINGGAYANVPPYKANIPPSEEINPAHEASVKALAAYEAQEAATEVTQAADRYVAQRYQFII